MDGARPPRWEKWYRLRAGPIERHSDAEKLLNRALPEYPPARLAIRDDAARAISDCPKTIALLTKQQRQPVFSDRVRPSNLSATATSTW